LHTAEELREGQGLPPKMGMLTTERVRISEPVPQLLVQPPLSPHLETVQSMEQPCVLQVRSISVEHSSPPWEAAVSTFIVRLWMPVPQDLEQEDQELQDTIQSTGQGWMLQVWRVVRLGQADPPKAGAVITERDFDWTPPPHFSVHPLDSKALTVQCTTVEVG
jgi:hypothetical protein